MPVSLPLLAPAAGCDCRRCPWYAGPDPADPAAVIAPLCSGSNADCSYCGCARAEARPSPGGGDVCRTCPVRCGSRTDIGAWMADVGGTLEFDDIDLGGGRLPAGLPRFIPQTDGSAVTGLDTQLRWGAYGVGLRRVFSPDTAALYPRFVDRDVHDVLGLRAGQLAVLVGYGLDPLVEAFWTRRRADRLVERIAAQGWDLVLAPNYSIFGNWPRAQHLLSMRMSLLIADEFVQAGMTTVPNLYWYRLEDLTRWAAWIEDTDPPAIAINLQTVRQDNDWQTWVLPGLHWLAENLPPHLPVIITGLSRAARIDLAVDLFGARLHLVSQNPHQFALHGAVMTADGRRDLHARPVDAFTASVTYMASLLPGGTAVTVVRRRFLLTAWDPALGAAVRPVAVLALDTGDKGAGHAVVWVPGSWDDADGWRDRLAGATAAAIAAAVPTWLAEHGGLGLAEIDAGPDEVDLRTGAEFALDEVLAVLLPLFPVEH